MNNRPTQLESMRKKHYDKLYARQQPLMKKLRPLLNKAELIERHTEPFLHSPTDPLTPKLEEPRILTPIEDVTKVIAQPIIAQPIVIDKRRVYRRELSKFSHSRKLQKAPTTKKVSEVRSDVLFSISLPKKKKRRM